MMEIVSQTQGNRLYHSFYPRTIQRCHVGVRVSEIAHISTLCLTVVQTNIKEYIKNQIIGVFSSQRASNVRNVSMSWCHRESPYYGFAHESERIPHDDVIKWKHFRVTGPLCGEFTGPGEFPTQRPVTRSFDVFFDLRLNKRLGKQLWGWWFETPSWSLWPHYNDSQSTINT